MNDILGLQVQLKYIHQMSFIGYLNPNDWKSDSANNDACNFTWSREQSIKQFVFEHQQSSKALCKPDLYTYIPLGKI